MTIEGLPSPQAVDDPISGSLTQRADAVWRRYARHPALWWTEHVSYRLGAIIVAAVMRSRITPNQLTILGLLVHGLGAAIVLWVVPATPASIGAVLLIWQLAYALDCADGLLARLRGASSPFGAWLDQVVDFAAHALVFAGLSVYLARALDLDGEVAAVVAVGGFAANMLQGYAAALRSATMERLGVTIAKQGWRGLAVRAVHLTDYGLFLLVAAIGLAVPTLLLSYLIVAGLLSVAAVCAQLVAYARHVD